MSADDVALGVVGVDLEEDPDELVEGVRRCRGEGQFFGETEDEEEEKDEEDARGDGMATLSYRSLARVNFGDFRNCCRSSLLDLPLPRLTCRTRVPKGLSAAGESKESGLEMKDFSNPCNSMEDSQTRLPHVD